LVTALREGSINLSVGELSDGGEKFLVRTVGEYRRLDDIADLVVTPNGMRLRDVATVRYSSREDLMHVSLDGSPGVVVLVVKESEANAVATCQAVHEELASLLEEATFRTAAVKIFFDQSELITSALDNLFKEGLYGGAMALGVLFFFLHRLRPTVIVALAIPTSLLIALVFMFFAGMELNLVTMVSMIIAVGMLVDNAIVVVENTIRHRQMGESPVDSARKGASEVGLAIFAATATTWVVFVPMYYLETGRMSVFMEQLGLPLIVALGGSLLIAVTVIPLAMSRISAPIDANVFLDIARRLPQRKADGHGLSLWVFSRLGEVHLVQRTIDGYAWCLNLSLHRRLASLLLLAGLVGLTFAVPYRKVGMRDLPKLDTREVAIDVEFDQNFDMDMARGYFGILEKEVNRLRDTLGVKNILSFHGSEGGALQVYLYTWEDGPLGQYPVYDTEEVRQILSTYLPERLPGAELSFAVADAGQSGARDAVSIRMRGDDTHVLEEYAERFKLVMEAIPGLSDVTTDVERDRQEMQIMIDEPLAEKAGVNPMVIAQTVDAALRGARLPYMKQGGREVSVWAQFREEDRKSKANLDNVGVVSESGALIPLHQLVQYGKALSPGSIHRVNAKNVVEITAKSSTQDLSAIRRDLNAAMNAFYLPLGYSIEFGDELDELSESAFQFSSTLLMAVILIYLVMSALFESFLLPMSILTTVPMALGGSMWMLFFTGTQLDTVTLIGNILMVGIIVNNGIVIVDHIRALTQEKGNREIAIVQAGRDRFRPVMMTAITTILGLVPLAMAKTGGAATFAGLGRALIGGLTAGTLLTLFVVPLFFTLLDDLQRWAVNYFGTLAGLRSRQSTETP